MLKTVPKHKEYLDQNPLNDKRYCIRKNLF